MESLTENQKNITDIYQELSYEELTTALNEYLNGGSTEEEEEEKEVVADTTSYNSKETSDALMIYLITK